MHRFCVATISMDDRLRPRHGVLRMESQAIFDDAREAGGRIVQEAQAEADAILRCARDEAHRLVERREQEVIREADILLQSIGSAYGTFLEGAQDVVLQLTQGVLDTLLVDLQPAERIAAAVARVVKEAPPRPVNARLWVHPEDAELLPGVEWEIKPDAAMPRGSCRLETSSGQWSVDFKAAVSAVRDALSLARNETTVDAEKRAPS